VTTPKQEQAIARGRVLIATAKGLGDDDPEGPSGQALLRDLLTDLIHAADANGLNYDRAADDAVKQWEEETGLRRTPAVWSVVHETKAGRRTVASTGHPDEAAARKWLVAKLDRKAARRADWRPTAAQYERAAAAVRAGEPPKMPGGGTYHIIEETR
jgi:hypothetical protein